ncbi:MAG: ribose-phosphate diphosphokinase [Aquiluna sp.]|nr:ribose-phosphate diphosphokinase [Aquiluna sp.]MCF8545387.1 ribose-phosphate diphosphokinase [Aquiluna sp.]
MAIEKAASKQLVIASGRAHQPLAQEVAELLNTELVPMTAYDFANGETFVRYERSVRGVDAFIIQAHPAPINHWVMEQLLMIDAMKRASAKRITVVAPFFPYGRQDKKHKGREPISARLMADLFRAAGATRLMSVDLHAPQIQGFFDGPVDHLWALPLLADHIKDTFGTENLTVVSPDSGRVRVADIWADRLGSPLAIVHKRRDPDRPNQVQVNEIVGDVSGRDCLLVDDMIDTGGTILAAAKALKANGAARVIVAATHPVFSHPAVERLSDPVIDSVVVTNTLPITPDKEFASLTVLSIAPLISKAIAAVFYDDSVNSLFPGHA